MLKIRMSITLAVTVAGTVCLADTGPHWPQWHGPARDNISAETGLLKRWPKGGPHLLWTASGCGAGYSSVAIANGMIYTAGTAANRTVVVAFDLDGKLKWKALNDSHAGLAAKKKKWAANYPGARATPTVDDGLVYHLNEIGRLAAFNAKTGREVWSVDLTTTFNAQWPQWGYAESVLIAGSNVICYPGGSKGYMVALDKKTGNTVWANKHIGDLPAYCSPILVDDHGIRQIITMSATAVLGVHAETGKLLWRHEHINRHNENINTPIYHDGFVLIASGHRRGSELLKLTFSRSRISVKEVWANKAMDTFHGGVILLDGFLYGTADRRNRWFCLDLKTGNQMYLKKGLHSGALTCADAMLYYLREDGKMLLIKPSPHGYRATGQFQVPRRGNDKYWAHPVVCGGRLYVRHADYLYAYDVKVEREDRDTSLHAAARYDDKKTAATLLDHGADVEARDNLGRSPLHVAAYEGCVAVARLLIEKQARVNAGDGRGDRPLHLAAQENRKLMADLLIKHGADINARSHLGTTPLHAAALFGNIELAALLIKHKALVHARGSGGGTALHVAASQDEKRTAELLLEHGADINVRGSGGNTPLHFAALLGSMQVAELLIKSKAKVSVENNDGVIPLHLAASGDEKLIAELLIKHGADVNARGDDGNSPLHFAAFFDSKAVAATLIKHKANVNARDQNGCSPLHAAAVRGNSDIVELLLAHKADVNARNSNGTTPLALALEQDNKDVAELLRKIMAGKD